MIAPALRICAAEKVGLDTHVKRDKLHIDVILKDVKMTVPLNHEMVKEGQ